MQDTSNVYMQELACMVWKQHMMEHGSKIVEVSRGMSVSRTYCEKCEDAEVIIYAIILFIQNGNYY